MKILPDAASVCPYCREAHTDDHCAVALGRAIGSLKRLDTIRARKAWTCPPMPMPDPIVAEVEGLIVILPPVPVEVEPPLTANEIKRAAIFVLSGQVREVTEAIQRVRATPWPDEGGS